MNYSLHSLSATTVVLPPPQPIALEARVGPRGLVLSTDLGNSAVEFVLAQPFQDAKDTRRVQMMRLPNVVVLFQIVPFGIVDRHRFCTPNSLTVRRVGSTAQDLHGQGFAANTTLEPVNV